MFRKFNSIENAYRKEHINRIQLEGHWAGEYVVQEKVHGANMSFYTADGVNFTACKRSGPVLPGVTRTSTTISKRKTPSALLQ